MLRHTGERTSPRRWCTTQGTEHSMNAVALPDPVDYQAVRTAYIEWRRYLDSPSSTTAAAFEDFYNTRVAAPFREHTNTAEAIFDDEMFPSLFSRLPIHAREGVPAIDLDALPKDWQ